MSLFSEFQNDHLNHSKSISILKFFRVPSCSISIFRRGSGFWFLGRSWAHRVDAPSVGRWRTPWKSQHRWWLMCCLNTPNMIIFLSKRKELPFMHRRLCMYFMYFMYFNMMDQSCWNTVKQSSANETNYCGNKTTKIALPNSRKNMNKLVA